MRIDTTSVLAEIDAVFDRCGASKDRPFPRTQPNPPNFIGPRSVEGSGSAMAASCLAAIERNAPHSSYVGLARQITANGKYNANVVAHLLGVLLSVRQDIEAGMTTSLEERVHERVFDDFLDMAVHVREIHPAPALILAGSVLEEHVRKLAEKNEIPVRDDRGRSRAFEQIGHDLVREDVFGEPQRKTLSAWYAQRTEAAHGRFESVVDDDAQRIIDGVRDFLARYPA